MGLPQNDEREADDVTASKGNDPHLFTSESVSMGHPDKVADQISDALLDRLIEADPDARTAIETLVTTGLVVLAGEVTVKTPEAIQVLHNAEQIARDTIRRIGYDDSSTGFDYRSCAVIRTLHAQSPDISRGVTPDAAANKEQGAGDQGLMFGFACNETRSLMPLPIQLAHRLVERLAFVRQEGALPWLRPDSKSQVTVRYEDGAPVALHTIVLSTQHTEDVIDPRTDCMSDQAKEQLKREVVDPVIEKECPSLTTEDLKLLVNPTGRFVIGGPHGDCGLTGRKIIVDTYGGRGRHGGGAFSGKDPSKVDRSAAYMARHIAKNIVAAGLAAQCEVQLAYAIGQPEPVSVSVHTFGTSEVPDARLADIVRDKFPLKPACVIDYLDLRRPIYFETARHGHFGREGDAFTWERTHRVTELRSAVKSIHAVR
ncbi:MAG: methionine adenosyltransferase [Planctomycetota bacterium]|nr:MAG: methionine adenosyltransferase [Planctomycetota bacterium]